MKVLYLNNNTPDYLAESLFHGLRTLLGVNCVDFPRYDSMYSPLTDEKRAKLRGNGFTLYGLLDELPELDSKRNRWREEISSYDLIVISDIWKLSDLFKEIIKEVPFDKIVVLDGSDSSSIFPYSSVLNRIIHNPGSFFIPVHKVRYFKRELAGAGESYRLEKILPYGVRRHIAVPKNLKTISFSIPQEKITKVDVAVKKKMFNRHIVDEEVAANCNDSFYSAIGSDKHYFTIEEDYYKDLRISKFGITTKRAGWDCMRHYELAANGAVVCFRELDHKHQLCAPHGFDQSNCIVYSDYNDLMKKINGLNDKQYEQLLANTYQWIGNNTTIKVAGKFIEDSLSNF